MLLGEITFTIKKAYVTGYLEGQIFRRLFFVDYYLSEKKLSG